MVYFNCEKEKTQTPKFTADVICPKCYQRLPYPTVVGKGTDRYGRTLRTYFGWCFDCNIGSQAIQFKKEDKWFIHKFLLYRLEDQQCKPAGGWHIICELPEPEPEPIMLGPGGDFTVPVEVGTTEDAAGLVDKMIKLAKMLTRSMECMIEALKK